ncbi:relaxase/mobilization nuclease, partial [Escherichia coli O111:H11 str. CVM9455]
GSLYRRIFLLRLYPENGSGDVILVLRLSVITNGIVCGWGTGPQGAIKRELFSDKESLWGYGLIQCRSLIEEMIADGDFSWQACHEMFARKGLML